MFLAAIHKPRQLFYASYIGRVSPEELERGLDDLKILLAELSPGFRVLADFERLESMTLECVPPLGRGMELIDRAGVGLLVRVMPGADRDIGLNIMTTFHYLHRPKIANCKSVLAAAKILNL